MRSRSTSHAFLRKPFPTALGLVGGVQFFIVDSFPSHSVCGCVYACVCVCVYRPPPRGQLRSRIKELETEVQGLRAQQRNSGSGVGGLTRVCAEESCLVSFVLPVSRRLAGVVGRQ